ncbi:MAG: hypothetical protein ACTSRS_12345 [Candidatus Helarchaeota archaeon]
MSQTKRENNPNKKRSIEDVWFPIISNKADLLYKDWIEAEVYDWVWELIKKKDKI